MASFTGPQKTAIVLLALGDKFTAEAFKSRMKEFYATFNPLQAFYCGGSSYRLVDGSGMPDEVYATVVKIFEEHA